VNRRRLSWLALAVVTIGVVTWAAWPSAGEPSVRERARALASELKCPDCEGLSVADSSTSSGRAIRADLRRRIAAGQSDARIRQVYVDRYGESILLKPERSGLGVLVWGLPVVALVLGAGGLALAFARWRRAPHLHASDADEQLVRDTRRASRDA
jgi:cytochrome c-type biogenesis protein CcmH